MLMPGDTTSNCYNRAFALTGQHCLCHLWQHVCICMGKHWVIFCVNISAFECSFWNTLKNGKSRPWTEPTVWCQPRYRIGSGWILSLVEIFSPLFLCAVMDGNKVCVKNVFLNKVQSVIKYQFASLSRPDGRLGLIASVFQSFCSGFVSINIDHMTTFSF